MLNEPGVSSTHFELSRYNALIEYKNIEIAILAMLSKKEGYYPSTDFDCFENAMHKQIQKNAHEIELFLINKANSIPSPTIIRVSFYRLQYTIDYSMLLINFQVAMTQFLLPFSIPNVITMET
jgi:hypothetical protein